MKSIAILFIFCATLNAELSNKQVLEAGPDLVELLTDVDPRAYGYRTYSHEMAVDLAVDPLVTGRFMLAYSWKLLPHLKLVVPVSFEDSRLALLVPLHERIDAQWSALAGAGLKLRISEWMRKSSFYVELFFQSGVYAQDARGFADTRYAIRLRPSFYAGWERLFETGLVFGAKLGCEYNFDLQAGKPVAYAMNQFVVTPMVNVGFAW